MGKNPIEVCYNSINHKVYVRRSGGSSIIIIDGATNEIIDSIIGIPGVHALVYNFLNNKLYCAYGHQKDSVLVIDCATNQIIKRILNTSCGGRSLFTPLNNKVYFANYISNSVSVIDCERDSLIKIIEEGIGEGPTAFCLVENKNKIYIINTWEGTVSVISSESDSVIKVIPIAPRPCAIGYNFKNKKIYVGHMYDPIISVICVEGDTLITQINVGAECQETIAYDSVYNKIYIPTMDYVAVIEGENNVVIDRIYLNGYPWVIFYNPLNKKIYCSYYGWRQFLVSIIDTKTRQVIDTIPLNRIGAFYPFCLNLWENRVYIPHAWSDPSGNPMDSVISVIRDVSRMKESSRFSFEIKYFPNSIKPEFIGLPNYVENVKIYNISGKLIKKKEKSSFKISLKSLKKGIYFIKTKASKREYLKKFIIIK